MTYEINIEKTKNKAICRICKKSINPPEIATKMYIDDGYQKKSMQTHLYCMMNKIIKDVLKIREQEIKLELNKFKEISNILK